MRTFVDPPLNSPAPALAAGRADARALQAIRDSVMALSRSSPSPSLVGWTDSRQVFVNRPGLALARSMGRSARRQFAADLGLAVARARLSGLSEHARLGTLAACSLHPLVHEGQVLGMVVILAANQAPVNDAQQLTDHAAVIASMDQGYCRLEVLDKVEGQPLDYRFVEINPAFVGQTGRADLLGRRASEAFEQRDPFWSQACEEVLVTGRMMHTHVPMNGIGRSYETCIMRLGGPGSRQLAVLLKDTTAQTLAQEHLERSEQQAREAAVLAEAAHRRLAAVIEATPAAVAVVNNDFDVLVMNAAARELRGSSPGSGPMRAVATWADGSERDGQELQPSEWPLMRSLRGETTRGVLQIDVPHEGRSCGVFLASTAPIRGPGGAIEGAVSVSFNITDRVMAERALKSASERKDEFLAMLAHELRNPLAPIAAAAELMRRPQASVDQMREGSLIIARQAQHLRGLIDDLLDASRVSRGQIKLQWRELDLRELLYQALEQSHPLMQARGHQLHLRLATQALPVRGDAKRLVQILSNVLNNAAKFTPPGGRVELSSWLDGPWVQVEVADSGIGMSEQTLANAFDLFAQGQISIDRQQGGLGIGLALVKKLAELHGGRVQAASEGLGCGSRLTISLPLVAQDDAPVARAPAADPLKRQTAQARRVLVVDDNVDAANTLTLLLRACGHACEVAHDAQQALALAAQSCPEVFILDIGLPGMDGRQLARHLREQPATQSAQIVALSGYAQPEDQQAALADGFDHYLVKPVDAQRLLELLAGD